MKLIIRFFILFCVFGLLVTCEKDETEKINQPPKIQSTTGSPQSIKTGETTQLTCVATDPDGDQLTYSWSSSKGTFPNGTSGSNVSWKAPDEPGNNPISIIVNDGQNTANGSVNITVEANLQLSVTPTELNFGITDSEKIFEIENNGSGTLSWSISENIEWLTLSTVSGESTTETDQVTVTVDRSELDPGSYNGTITITSDGGNQNIAVSMEVSEVPTLSVTPTSLDFGTELTELTFNITNGGTGTLTWTISESINWLTLDITSGSTTTEPDQITVTAARGGLDPGDYNSTITITSDGGNQDITVSMEVSEVPTLSVTPTSLDFGTTTTQKSFEITNSGTGTLTWSISESISWLTLNTSSGNTSAETDQISVTVNRSGLDPNSYNGAISITSDGGNQDVTVTMEVPSEKATVTTTNPSNISCSEVTLGGNVTDDGGATVTERGIVYSSSQNPTTSDNKITIGAGTGIFSTVITGLELNTTYHVRAYAINNAGTSYGNDLIFTTPNKPNATTLTATNITYNSVTLNGQVNANGSPTTVTFVYYSMPGDYKTVTAIPSTVTGTNTVNVSANITGLAEGLTYTYYVKAENCAGTTNGTNEDFTTTASPSSFVRHIGISKTNINLTSIQAVGQITINPSVAGKVIVTFDGDCTSSPGDRILLAACNTTSIGVNDAHVSLEATNSDLNERSFSHTRAYSVSAGSNTFYALAEQSDVEYEGSGIASIYGSLTVEFIPNSTSLVGFTGISKTNVDLTNKTTLATVTINPSVSGKAIVRFTGTCLSSPGDRIILASSNTTNWGTDDGAVGVEAINSDLNRNPFSHTRVYNVTAGSKTFYAIGQNYVEYDGNGNASIYGSLTVEFIPDINTRSFAVFTGISRTNVNLSSSTVLSQLTINPAISGKVLVRFDGSCISSPGDKIILAASNTTNWGTNDGNVSMEAYDSDINGNSFSHTRVYSVSPGSRTFYAIGHNYVETDGTGIASVYGSLTVVFFPDE